MQKTITALALAATLGTTSCIGPDNAHDSVASWNSRVSDSKFINEVVFIGLHIVPVYQIALFGDRLIFNSIEFWGGENPISKPEPITSQGDK